jgi:hypothetical protein
MEEGASSTALPELRATNFFIPENVNMEAHFEYL